MARKTVASFDAEQRFRGGVSAAHLDGPESHVSVVISRNLDDLFEHLMQHNLTDLTAMDFHLSKGQPGQVVEHGRASSPHILIAILADFQNQHATGHVVTNQGQTAAALGNGSFADADLFGHAVDGPSIFLSAGRPEGATGTELDGALAGLTRRQQQVIRLLTQGYSNKLIARELGISPCTVKAHVQAAFRALGVHTRMAAAATLRQARGAPSAAPDVDRRQRPTPALISP